MRFGIFVIFGVVLSVFLAGCASNSVPDDSRVLTDLTPYRSIAPYIECGGCVK